MTADAPRTDPAPGEGERAFRPPLSQRILSLAGTIVLALVTVLMAGAAVLGFRLHWALGLFMTAVAGFMGALAGYAWRNLRGIWSLRVALGDTAATFDLPADRSLIHRPPALHATIPYADIAAIETRREAYGSLGMEMMQRPYVLRRKSGELIFLFEERALASPLASSFYAAVVAELAARAGVTPRDLGMVEGGGGFLAVWGAHAPDWAAPSLPLARQIHLWRHAASTGSLAMSLTLFVVILMSYYSKH